MTALALGLGIVLEVDRDLCGRAPAWLLILAAGIVAYAILLVVIYFWWVVGGLAAIGLARLGLEIVRRRT